MVNEIDKYGDLTNIDVNPGAERRGAMDRKYGRKLVDMAGTKLSELTTYELKAQGDVPYTPGRYLLRDEGPNRTFAAKSDLMSVASFQDDHVKSIIENMLHEARIDQWRKIHKHIVKSSKATVQ